MHGGELHEGELLIHTMFKLCVFLKKHSILKKSFTEVI